MSAPQVGSALIDLSTYGELESYLYARPSVKEYVPMKQRLSNTMVVILIIIFLIYIKG
jgi:hypothetical protein